MPTNQVERLSSKIKFPFYNVRHISAPEDLESDRKVYVGYVPITSVIDLPTDENVRDYLVEAEGKKRRRKTQVHLAIEDTLRSRRQDFSVLNGGIVLVARTCEIFENEKYLLLGGASIINGSQTQGIIKEYIERQQSDGQNGFADCHLKYEVIVTSDDELIAEVSIARNFQNDVMSISIAGRLKELDELEEAYQKQVPGSKLQKSESKLSDDYVKTERLLQVITALIPESLWPKDRGEFSKVFTYSRKAMCLKFFRDIRRIAKEETDHPLHAQYRDLYQFFLDIAAPGFALYEHWKESQAFRGIGVQGIEREAGKIVDVPDGMVFPIIASYSVFMKRTPSGWVIDVPLQLSERDLVLAAKSAYMDIARSNYNAMGKNKACYTHLYSITSIYQKLKG